jgi:acyl-CoA synthetase (AMP-forming)/AMP-acid ligase II
MPLADRVQRLAAALTHRGVGRRGGRVAVNYIAVFGTLFATGMCGAIFVPLNYQGSAVLKHGDLASRLLVRMGLKHELAIVADGHW